jgi:hypothetical protein
MSTLINLAWILAFAGAPTTTTDCGESICVYANDSRSSALSSGNTWKPDARLTRRARAAEAKKQRKRKDVDLRVELHDRRGSVFVDGRYLALQGPYAVRALKPGKHELEVRDGDEVIAVGVLTISTKAAAVTVVVHGDR